MIQPKALEQNVSSTKVAEIFGTPVVVVGKTWLPVTQIVIWAIMTRLVAKKSPERSFREHLTVGGLSMAAILGSEWGHNLAHAAAANWVGKPMDAIRITGGMPLCVYHDIHDENVSLREHIFRALGGPVFNTLLLGLVSVLRYFTPTESRARQITDYGLGMNAFLATASLLPIPGIDGGPILKWGLVESGHSIKDADMVVRQVDKVTGLGLGIVAGVAMKKKRWFWGVISGMLSAIALAVGFGLLKEQA